MTSSIHVAAAIILSQDNRVLLSLRPQHVHQGGKWEFPGGKIEASETATEGLRRELKEELDIEAQDVSKYLHLQHEYPDKQVILDVFLVKSFSGTARGVEGQQVQWFTIAEMLSLTFPDANYPILEQLRHDFT